MFQLLVSEAGLTQFDYDNINQFLILTEEEYNDEHCKMFFGKLIRQFVALVAGICADCMCLVRGFPAEACGVFEINHGKRNLPNYMTPFEEAQEKGCLQLMDSVADYYDGSLECKGCHKKDDLAHKERGQNLPQARVSLLCPGLRMGLARTRHMSLPVSSVNEHDVSDFVQYFANNGQRTLSFQGRSPPSVISLMTQMSSFHSGLRD